MKNNEHTTTDDENQVIDQIARFCVLVARDVYEQECKNGVLIVTEDFINKTKKRYEPKQL